MVRHCNRPVAICIVSSRLIFESVYGQHALLTIHRLGLTSAGILNKGLTIMKELIPAAGVTAQSGAASKRLRNEDLDEIDGDNLAEPTDGNI